MKKVSKSRKRRLLIMGTASIVAFVFLCINIINYAYKITSLTKKQKELMITYNNLLDEKEKLENDIEKFKNDEYLAAYARETYLYTKKDEYVIKIQESEAKLDEIEEDINKLDSIKKYVFYASGIGLITLFVIVLKKKS